MILSDDIIWLRYLCRNFDRFVKRDPFLCHVVAAPYCFLLSLARPNPHRARSAIETRKLISLRHFVHKRFSRGNFVTFFCYHMASRNMCFISSNDFRAIFFHRFCMQRTKPMPTLDHSLSFSIQLNEANAFIKRAEKFRFFCHVLIYCLSVPFIMSKSYNYTCTSVVFLAGSFFIIPIAK